MVECFFEENRRKVDTNTRRLGVHFLAKYPVNPSPRTFLKIESTLRVERFRHERKGGVLPVGLKSFLEVRSAFLHLHLEVIRCRELKNGGEMKTKMLNLVIATGCMTAAVAHAQSSVTLYGNVDGGVAFFNNVGGKTLYTSEDGNFIPNLFGLRGAEDLGGGAKAVFNLEGGFTLNNGKLVVPGQLFTRVANVGLQSDTAGTLTLGNQPSFMFDILSPYSTGYLAAGFFAFHQGNFDELANTFEYNNSVKYVSPSFGGLTFGGQFGFGQHPGSFSTGRNYSLTVQYKAGPLSVGAVYADENDRFLEFANLVGVKSLLGTPLPTAGIVASNVKNWGLGGTYAIGNFYLHALVTQSRIKTTTGQGNANTVDLGTNYTLTKSDSVGAGVSVEKFDGSRWVTLTLANIYSFSKRTNFYQQLLFQKTSGDNAVAALLGAGQSSNHSQLGVVVGLQHMF